MHPRIQTKNLVSKRVALMMVVEQPSVKPGLTQCRLYLIEIHPVILIVLRVSIDT